MDHQPTDGGARVRLGNAHAVAPTWLWSDSDARVRQVSDSGGPLYRGPPEGPLHTRAFLDAWSQAGSRP